MTTQANQDIKITRQDCVTLFSNNKASFEDSMPKDLYHREVERFVQTDIGMSFTEDYRWSVLYVALQSIFLEVSEDYKAYLTDMEEEAYMERYQEMCDSGELFYRSVTSPDMWGSF